MTKPSVGASSSRMTEGQGEEEVASVGCDEFQRDEATTQVLQLWGEEAAAVKPKLCRGKGAAPSPSLPSNFLTSCWKLPIPAGDFPRLALH